MIYMTSLNYNPFKRDAQRPEELQEVAALRHIQQGALISQRTWN